MKVGDLVRPSKLALQALCPERRDGYGFGTFGMVRKLADLDYASTKWPTYEVYWFDADSGKKVSWETKDALEMMG